MATTTYATKREYKDIALVFDRHPITNDITSLTNADAIKYALRHILFTQVGEVPFFPEWGSRLRRLLFEPADNTTAILIQNEIKISIEAFEPRIIINSISLTLSDDELQYNVAMVYTLRDATQPVTISFALLRLR